MHVPRQPQRLRKHDHVYAVRSPNEAETSRVALMPRGGNRNGAPPIATSARFPRRAPRRETKVLAMPTEIYVSTDIEADGPIPGPHSMLSFASAAYGPERTLIGTFTRNLETLEGAAPDPKTAAWWKTQPEAWAACRSDLQPPASAMGDYVIWLDSLPGRPVFVGYPAAYDFMFVYWYLMKFVGHSPFSHSALDIKTFAMCLLGKSYRDSGKRNMPQRWFEAAPHTHVALDDALEQGALFCNMLREAQHGV